MAHQSNPNKPLQTLLSLDPYLKPYEAELKRRFERFRETESRLTGGRMSIAEFASAHEYFGLHFTDNQWVFREWAPNADAIYMIGEMTGWRESKTYAMEKDTATGIWEIRLSADQLSHGNQYRLRIHWGGTSGDRIPAYARRVVQDPQTLIFNAQVWFPPQPYQWRCPDFRAPGEPPLIYEAHVGMAQEEGKVGTYEEFSEKILPRIRDAGYNVIQLMAIQEHPYYGSFGYHVSNFFAPSSRFGTPEELKKLVNRAHEMGIAVIMDIVHSHAVSGNTGQASVAAAHIRLHI